MAATRGITVACTLEHHDKCDLLLKCKCPCHHGGVLDSNGKLEVIDPVSLAVVEDK